jgi:hypothetical protein
MKALPMMAPLANCVAWLNVSLLLIQNQSLGDYLGSFRNPFEIRFLVAANPDCEPVTLAELTI